MPATGRRDILWLPLATLVVGLIVTAALTWLAEDQFSTNEQRLLALRVRDAGAVLAADEPAVQTPLASAAELADLTRGDVGRFRRFITPYVLAPGHPFVSASLWKLGAPQRGPLVVVGARPELRSAAAAADFLHRAGQVPKLSVIGLLARRPPRLGYEYDTRAIPGGYAAYAEAALPAHRLSMPQRNAAFTGLDYALYLGRSRRRADLLLASRPQLPIPGPTAATIIPFGDSALTLVMSSHAPLAGTLPARLAWIVGVVGVLLSTAAAGGAYGLSRRRLEAEVLAVDLEQSVAETRRLYAEQRTIAQTLQHALLPERLPEVPDFAVTAIYSPGEQGVEIGGDWYDVLDLGGRRLLLVVGDVSGHGLRAATTMSALRHAIHAYAADGDAPAEILTKLSRLLSVRESGQLATIICARLDAEGGGLELACAGHLPPLVVDRDGARYLKVAVGVPIGVQEGEVYATTELQIAPGQTLLVFTDGLIERRGETLDDGMGRLRASAGAGAEPLPELLERIVREVPPGPAEDDVAVLGLRWEPVASAGAARAAGSDAPQWSRRAT